MTGATGQIGRPLAEFLARENEVWGVARLRRAGAREQLVAAGITPVALELSSGDYGGLPSDFSYVVHLAAFLGTGTDFDKATRINAEGTGRLLHHCRRAKAALVMSTHSVYAANSDPFFVYDEGAPLGESHSEQFPTYSMSKIGQEAVARSSARTLGLPVLIARMNASYGPNGGLPAYQLDSIVAGEPVLTRFDPCPYSIIHQDDINSQTPALLDAASVPAPIVNWAGDEVVSVQQWCAYGASLVEPGHGTSPLRAEVVVNERAGSQLGAIADVSRRAAITGPCTVPWRSGIRDCLRRRHPALDLVEPVRNGAEAPAP